MSMTIEVPSTGVSAPAVMTRVASPMGRSHREDMHRFSSSAESTVESPTGRAEPSTEEATSPYWLNPVPESRSADILKLSPETAKEAASNPCVVIPPSTAAATRPGTATRANLRQRVPPRPSFVPDAS